MRPSATIVALASVAACRSTSPRTEIMVEVSTDLDVPAELDGLQVTVQRREVMVFDSGRIAHTAFTLPTTLGVVPDGDDLATPITITANGYLGTEVVVNRIARLPFVKGRTLLLPLTLVRACRQKACAEGHTCRDGECGSPDVDPSTLGQYDPKRRADGGTFDVGTREGADTGSTDVGAADTGDASDAGVVDGAPGGAGCTANATCASRYCGANNLCCATKCAGDVGCESCSATGVCEPLPVGTDCRKAPLPACCVFEGLHFYRNACDEDSVCRVVESLTCGKDIPLCATDGGTG